MRGFGLHARLRGGRILVVGVVLQRRDDGVTPIEEFRHEGASHDDFPLQLAGLGDAFQAFLTTAAPDAVVVRTMDFAPRRRENEMASKYGAEGVLLAVARRQVPRTERLRGIDIGLRCGTDKTRAEEEAERLCGTALKEAGSAALAALFLAENP